jgi:hypothetical protein
MNRRHAITQALGLAGVDVILGSPEAAAGSAAAAGPAVTPRERAAAVTVTNPEYNPGDVRRYGARGDGVADDSAAWRAALSTGHRVLGGSADLTYSLDSEVPVTRATAIDLQGAVLRPKGNTRCLVRDPPAASATGEVSAGAEQGSRTLTLASGSGFRPGQWLRLSLNDVPAHDPASYPPSWSQIVAVRGSAIDLDTPLQVSYGPGALRAIASERALMPERFECRNGIFDGSDCTYDGASGHALRIGGVESVVIEGCEFRNFRFGGATTTPVQLYVAVDVLVRACRFTGNISRSDVCDIQDVRFAHFVDNFLDGSHFGCDVLRADALLFADNSMHGQRAREFAEAISPVRSVRGLKAYGCAAVRILSNHIADYESAVKVQACFRYDVSHNAIFNCGLSPYSGQIALNVGSIKRGRNMHPGRLIGNHVESCGGLGIGVTSDAPGGVIISGNIVRATQGMALYLAVPESQVLGNRFEDWGQRRQNDAAVHVAAGASVADNRFAHSTNRSLPCIESTGGSNSRLVLRDNVSESGNPLPG